LNIEDFQKATVKAEISQFFKFKSLKCYKFTEIEVFFWGKTPLILDTEDLIFREAPGKLGFNKYSILNLKY
jgi:hypothetical protein